MKMILRTAFPACLALLAMAGCKQADRAVSAPVTHAELPSFERLKPTLAIVVGVEGAREVPRVIFVPQYEKIVLTPEEREALGERELPEPDVLVLHRPRRGPEDGVSPESFQALTGIGGIGGALVGHDSAYQPYGLHGFAGHHARLHALPRSTAGVGMTRARMAGVGRGWLLTVGEGLAREGARRAPRAERR